MNYDDAKAVRYGGVRPVLPGDARAGHLPAAVAVRGVVPLGRALPRATSTTRFARPARRSRWQLPRRPPATEIGRRRCTRSTAITSCCRCPRGIASRWTSTRACGRASCDDRHRAAGVACMSRTPRHGPTSLRVHTRRLRGARPRRPADARATTPHRLPVVGADGRAVAALGGRHASTRRAPRCRTASSANLAGGTHHAFRDRGEGYCVFNDVAVAAMTMLETGRVRQVAVIDLDVHQGNGTAAIFEHDPRVFTCSLHGAANFPFRKERSDLDVPLPDGTGDEEYLAHLVGALDAVLATGPDLRVLRGGRRSLRGRSAGADAPDRGGVAAARCDRVRAVPGRARARGSDHGRRVCARRGCDCAHPRRHDRRSCAVGAALGRVLRLARPNLGPATLLRLGNPLAGIGAELALLADRGCGRGGSAPRSQRPRQSRRAPTHAACAPVTRVPAVAGASSLISCSSPCRAHVSSSRLPPDTCLATYVVLP